MLAVSEDSQGRKDRRVAEGAEFNGALQHCDKFPDYATLRPGYSPVGLHKRSVAGDWLSRRKRQSLIPAYD